MAIKIGFSSMVCPAWDLKTMLTQARDMGFDGIELRNLSGTLHLPEVPELTDDPSNVLALAKQTGVSLVCLGCSAAFESPDPKALDQARRQLSETLELAGKLEVPYVRIFLGDAQAGEHRGTLGRIASELRKQAPLAARCRTTILVENGGDFCGSTDLWFIVDAAAHPNVAACWNPLNGRFDGEAPTRSVPRLGSKLKMFRLADGDFDPQGRFLGYQMPGSGDVDLKRGLELLKGVCFQGWLMFEWPKMIATLPEPEAALPKVLEFAHNVLTATDTVLSAYKGDKNAPNFQAPTAVETAKGQ
ncbi:MAG: sugar phosphate isomerase/epimerase family protein [Phycisphaerae bacterium]